MNVFELQQRFPGSTVIYAIDKYGEGIQAATFKDPWLSQ
jgi:hypothetical protein